MDKIVNENRPEKDEMENEVKENTELLENIIDKGLPEQGEQNVKVGGN